MATKAQLQAQIEKLQAENQSLIETMLRQDKDFNEWRANREIDPVDCVQLQQENEKLKFEIAIMKMKCETQKKDIAYWKAKALERTHNERNAGRKCKLTTEQIAAAQKLRMQGKSFREIAEQIGCSVGTAHKVCSENK